MKYNKKALELQQAQELEADYKEANLKIDDAFDLASRDGLE